MIETRQMSFEDIKPKRLTKYMQILEIIGNRVNRMWNKSGLRNKEKCCSL